MMVRTFACGAYCRSIDAHWFVGWDTITKVIGGEDAGEVRPLVRSALERVSASGVGIEEGLWLRPAYDGQRVIVEDGKVWDTEAPGIEHA